MKSIRFYFDYIDPACRLMELRVREVAVELDIHVELVPFEIRTPKDPPIVPGGPAWTAWWERALSELRERGIETTPFQRVPLTRKAHELRLHAIERGFDDEVHARLWVEALEKATDLARIDLLVRIAEELGMDGSEAKVVLDVDRWTAEVVRLRDAATRAGVRGVPSLMVGADLMEGVHDADAIREFVTEFEPSEE